MSRRVREWLARLNLLTDTTHEERKEIDREIEARKDVYCDEAIEKGMVSEEEFIEIVNLIKRRRRRMEVAYAV